MVDLIKISGSGDSFKGALEAFKRELSSHIEFVRLTSKIRKAVYDSLIEEGFTKEEALEIVKVWKPGT